MAAMETRTLQSRDLWRVGIAPEQKEWWIPWADLPGTRFRVHLEGTIKNGEGSVITLSVALGPPFPDSGGFVVIDEDAPLGPVLLPPFINSAPSDRIRETSAWFAKPVGHQLLKLIGSCTVEGGSSIEDWSLTVESDSK